jgi:hypothetical protein
VDALSRWALTFLLNSLWQVTLVVGAMALGDLWLRRAPARYRHALWVMALVAAVVLPAASTLTLRTVSAHEGALAQVSGTWQTPLPAATSTAPTVPVNAHHPQPGFLGKALQAGIHRGVAMPPALMRALRHRLSLVAHPYVATFRGCLASRAHH